MKNLLTIGQMVWLREAEPENENLDWEETVGDRNPSLVTIKTLDENSFTVEEFDWVLDYNWAYINYNEGDILVNSGGEEAEIISVGNKLIVISVFGQPDVASDNYTRKEIENNGWKVKI